MKKNKGFVNQNKDVISNKLLPYRGDIPLKKSNIKSDLFERLSEPKFNFDFVIKNEVEGEIKDEDFEVLRDTIIGQVIRNTKPKFNGYPTNPVLDKVEKGSRVIEIPVNYNTLDGKEIFKIIEKYDQVKIQSALRRIFKDEYNMDLTNYTIIVTKGGL